MGRRDHDRRQAFPEAQPGDYVIVHVGFALSIVDEKEANQVFDYLRQMDELGELGDDQGAAARPSPSQA